ncbi:MAG TPA: hypothetical protein VJH22_01360 [Candidatus Nanoarchaeia archaeon]|nr:hypothetical protein [Candidatus Nanoarchaeia archaeon]
MESVCVSKEQHAKSKRRQALADDVILQLEMSLKDAEAGRIRRVR